MAAMNLDLDKTSQLLTAIKITLGDKLEACYQQCQGLFAGAEDDPIVQALLEQCQVFQAEHNEKIAPLGDDILKELSSIDELSEWTKSVAAGLGEVAKVKAEMNIARVAVPEMV